MNWWVYILLCSDDSYYTGITNDLNRRLRRHQEGKASKYTRARLPVKLVYWDECSDRSEASKREYQMKQLSHRMKRALIIQLDLTKQARLYGPSILKPFTKLFLQSRIIERVS
jgi:predicted GIY-YIG superfamily endonuclease